MITPRLPLAMFLHKTSGGVCPSFLVIIESVSCFRVESIHPAGEMKRLDLFEEKMLFYPVNANVIDLSTITPLFSKEGLGEIF